MTTITLPRATVEQALEALERLQNALYNIGGEHVTGLHVANDAADSAEKPMGALRAALAESVQEPVAWRYQDARGNYRYRGYVQGFEKEYWRLKPVPLYTAPPQRKPLTDEEIPALAKKAWTPSVYCDAEALLGTDGLLALVRAVEAKHNIKE